MPWSSWINAEIYDRFVRERSIYGWLNERLVELARISTARRILDLGCGTGATTLSCLPRMPREAEIVGIDASEPMVRVARDNVLDPRASFEVGAAAEVDRLGGRFDRVVCNAAFWQFPAAAPVFRALARTTLPGARFVFSVPAERVESEPSTIHPFQVALMQEIERERDGPLDVAPVTVDPATLERQAADQGFERAAAERHVYAARQAELIELMTIPAMSQPVMPGLSEARRERVLQRAARRVDRDESVDVPWIFFAFTRAG